MKNETGSVRVNRLRTLGPMAERSRSQSGRSRGTLEWQPVAVADKRILC